MSERPRLLDLFCGAGGAAMGYHRAGFDVVGVDIRPQPNYPFKFVQHDAMKVLASLVENGHALGEHFDAVHASPPCQHASTIAKQQRIRRPGRYEHPNLLPATRQRLAASGLPYVIENVIGAELVNPIMLCGTAFGLGADGRQLHRHRLFESNVPMMSMPCWHQGQAVGVYGNGGGGQMSRGYKARGVGEAREALGIDWMTLKELSQAIPPAFTEHVGSYLIAALNAQVAA